MTKMRSDSRTEAQDRLIEAAQAKGGEAVLAMRFDASEFQVDQEICAYGTAVKIRRRDLWRGPAAAGGAARVDRCDEHGQSRGP